MMTPPRLSPRACDGFKPARFVAVPPLTPEFNRKVRRRDYAEFRRCIAACEAHLEDLRIEHARHCAASRGRRCVAGIENRGHDRLAFPDALCRLKALAETGFNTIEIRFADVFANLPNRIVAWIFRVVSQPFGARHRSPADALTRRCAQLLPDY
jgi:Domain of unknown function (DUF1974)